jgi:WD40 repeat protein
MSSDFEYDVFLSYSSKDKEKVHALAQRLKQDGLRVWLDAWAIRPGDSIPLKIQQGLEQSRILFMCMSPDYFASDWGRMEHLTLLFRDPTNAEQRFIPLLMAECQPPDIIAQFARIDWMAGSKEAYASILTACLGGKERKLRIRYDQSIMALTGHLFSVRCVAITPDGKTIVSGSVDKTLKLWDLATGICSDTWEGYSNAVLCVAVASYGDTVVSGSEDGTLKLWDLNTSRCFATFEAHIRPVFCVAIAPNNKTVVSGSIDRTLKIWNLQTGSCRCTLEGHADAVHCVAITTDGKSVVSGSKDRTLKLWDLATGRYSATLHGHTDSVYCVAVTPDGRTIVSGSADGTLKVWDLENRKCKATLEGQADSVFCVAISPDCRTIVSGSKDKTLKIWDLKSGICRATLEGHTGYIFTVAVTPDGQNIVSGSSDDTLRVWAFSQQDIFVDDAEASRYTNAKVVLVGETGVGKTGLALRLCENRWEPTESTHGMIISRLELPSAPEDERMEREVWLWDFAGQTDYRLIHQLYMDEAALGVLVFNPQDDNPFEGIGHWEKAISAATKFDPAKLLVAARCDRGGATISQRRFEEYIKEHSFAGFLCTGAQDGRGLPGA